jgi:hypothetical protein
MNKKPGTSKDAANKLVESIRRKTRQTYSAAEEIQRGSAASPLSRSCGTTTHILQLLLTVRCPKGSQRKRVTDPHLAARLCAFTYPKGAPCSLILVEKKFKQPISFF